MAITLKPVPEALYQQFAGKLPHICYELPLHQITAGKGLAGASQTGWRFLLQTKTGQHHLVEVVNTSAGTYTYGDIETGDVADTFAAIIERLKVNELVQMYHYEVTYLRVPACEVMAIWLRGDDHSHEVLVPLASVGPYLSAQTVYSAREFTHCLDYIARERILREDMYTLSDDITRIEGIGPKAAELLRQAGFVTFGQLANAEATQLSDVLRKGGPQYNRLDTATWPRQAQLAADGNWNGLARLQETLLGGRSV